MKINEVYIDNKAISFCKEFIHSDRPKYIFGRNVWAESISSLVNIDGFIDDFTEDDTYLGKPIVPITEVPEDAVVVVVVVGKPLVAEKRVRKFCFDSIDYYSFYKYSGLPLENIMFWDGMIDDIKANLDKYNWVYGLLSDSTSRHQFCNIINFRLSYDLDYMRGFEAIEEKQYFEKFLNLGHRGETFVDIGGYDGFTTQKFINLCPQYEKIFFFEPEEKNMLLAKKNLQGYKGIDFFQLGLADKKGALMFDISGSSSKISSDGEIVIKVDRLDNIVTEKITFVKMDIEGAERDAISGATELIRKYHPKLAISVYHRKDDFWRIPEQVLAIRNDYKIYLRHYTEGISETIMFFIPETA